ncbi:MAG: carboxypeptidase regulatory-like domain-containing protein [Bacteroidetes bacterium]|nr:carboxypeptidase regulatory-like domain-containing protein [Bacteroidota bacterium]
MQIDLRKLLTDSSINYYCILYTDDMFCKIKLISIFLFVLIQMNWVYAQVSGELRDRNENPVALAEVRIYNVQATFEVTSDSAGKFSIPDIKAGRYILTVTKSGYKSYIQPELLIATGKPLYLNITLDVFSVNLAEATVSSAMSTLTRIHTTYHISSEQTQRFASANDDAARAMTYYPGLVQLNDGTNHISANGNSPNATGWFINDLPVMNPNHLANAGTFSDRPAPSGGGITMFSNQVLEGTSLYNGNMKVQHINCLAAAMQMKFRNGNALSHNSSIQTGLIGVDVASEGPLGKKGKASYLINYRYSFTGILAMMGVTFGGEDIRFQDVTYNLNFPLGKKNTIQLFGVAGNSSNVFKHEQDSGLWESQKQLLDINYKQRNIFAAFSWTHTFDTKFYLKLSGAFNSFYTNHQVKPRFPELVYIQSRSETGDTALPLHLYLNQSLNGVHSLRYGVIMNLQRSYISQLSVTRRAFNMNAVPAQQLNRNAYYGYINYTINTGKFYSELGVQHSEFTNFDNTNISTALRAQYLVSKRHLASVTFNNTAQMQQVRDNARAYNFRYAFDNYKVQPNRSIMGTVNYFYTSASMMQLSTQFFYQQLYHIASGGIYSVLNSFENDMLTNYANNGEGRNRGVNVSLEKPLLSNFYHLVSVSVYDAKVKIQERWYDSRYNGRYSMQYTGGYEKRNKRENTWGINLHGIYAGGMRTKQLDTLQSIYSEATIVEASPAFNRKLKDYFRADLRITYRINGKKSNTLLAMDIQNITGNENENGWIYDALTKEFVTRRQLGLIPVLSCRWQF